MLRSRAELLGFHSKSYKGLYQVKSSQAMKVSQDFTLLLGQASGRTVVDRPLMKVQPMDTQDEGLEDVVHQPERGAKSGRDPAAAARS